MVEIGDLECGAQYYAIQCRGDGDWSIHLREMSLPHAVRMYNIVKDSEFFEWRIVYVSEVIRVINYVDV